MELYPRFDRWIFLRPVIWEQVFQKYEESIPGSLRRTILDKCKEIEGQIEFWLYHDIRQELRNKYEDLGTKLISKNETPYWKNVSENLSQMYDEYSLKRNERRSLDLAHHSLIAKLEPFGSLMQERTVNSVSVEDIYGNKQVYNGVTYTDSVETLMSRIEQKTKIPKRELVLICNGKRLEEKGMLNSYDIDKSTILLLRQKRTVDRSPDVGQSSQDDVEPKQYFGTDSQEDKEPKRKIRIKVKHVKGIEYALKEVKTHDSILSLKRMVASKIGNMTEDEIILLHQDKELCDNDTLDTYGITNGETVFMLHRSRGKGLMETARSLYNEALNMLKYLGECVPGWFADSTRAVTLKEICKVSQEIGKNWELIGPVLGLDEVQMDQITEDNRDSTVKKIYSMLTTWWNKNEKEATVGQLYLALEQCKRVRINWTKIKNIFSDVDAVFTQG